MPDLFKKIMLLILISLFAIPVSLAAEEAPPSSEDQEPGWEVPEFEEVSVHDPSIIKEGDYYYVFGTHIEAARSTDLISWERFTNGYTTPGNTLYGDLSENLAGSFEWAGEDDADSAGGFAVWAPDVFWNEDYVWEDGSTGAYMIYYSASSTYIRSAIGYAVSKEIEGPYQYVDTIIYSGFTEDEAYDENSDVNKQWTNTNIDELIEQGEINEVDEDWFNDDGSFNNLMYPNAIDATLFRDEEGQLWMTYGSWSGGLFLLRLDEETGKPIYPGEDGETEDGRMIDRYFGTKISGGYFKSGEGPFIVYNEENDYYYLYVTYGWLGADGEYQQRVFRSESPDGPYLDADGQNAVLPGDVDHSPYGNKLLGHFLFDRKPGDLGEGVGYGYISPGHNSVYIDEETGQQFLFFHTRFPDQGEHFELRVHQMFLNDEGWPVVAPYRYGGEELEEVDPAAIVGDYQLINHGLDISQEVHTDVNITLEENNTITGAVEGTWELAGESGAEITIDGVTYEGVFIRQYNPETERFVMTFTAVSDEGVSIWGSKLPRDLTDEEVVAAVREDLTIEDADRIVTDLVLPVEGTRGSAITWSSSNPEVVAADGTINRPAPGEEAISLTLTAVITKGEFTGEKTFDITVLPMPEKELVAEFEFNGNLAEDMESFDAGTVTGNRIDNTGGTITYTDGVFGQAAEFDGNSGVRLPDNLITGTSYSVSYWLNPEELTGYTTSFFGARNNTNWISLLPGGLPGNNQAILWSGGPTFREVPTETQLPLNEWTHVAFTVSDGEAIVYLDGEAAGVIEDFNNVFTGDNSQFALGVNWWDAPFQGLIDELKIYSGVLSPEEVEALADPTVEEDEVGGEMPDTATELPLLMLTGLLLAIAGGVMLSYRRRV